MDRWLRNTAPVHLGNGPVWRKAAPSAPQTRYLITAGSLSGPVSVVQQACYIRDVALDHFLSILKFFSK